MRARALNGLLRRSPDAPVEVPDEGEIETVGVTLDEALALAHASSGPLLKARAEARRTRAMAHASELKVTVPDFSVAWETFAPVNNTSLGWGAMARMTLPWLWNGERGGARADTLEARAAAADVDAEIVEVDTAVRTAFERVRSAERRVRVIVASVAPAASRSLDSATSGYASGAVPLERILRASEMVLEARDMRVDAEGDLRLALNDLDAAVGAPVKRAPFDLTEAKP